jgi:hypothetical protein
MSDEGKKIGRCGWMALAIVLFLLPGLLAGSFYGGFAGLRAAKHFLSGEAAHLVTQAMVLSGMIAGLLLSTMIVMALTIAIVRTSASLPRNSKTCSPQTVNRNQTQ